MIIPALYRLTERGELTVPVIGVALHRLGPRGDCARTSRCASVPRSGRRRRRGAERAARPRAPRRRRLRRRVHVPSAGCCGPHAGWRHRVRGALPGRAAGAVRHGGRRARRGRVARAGAAGGGEALRPRPRLGAGARRPVAPPLRRGPDLPGGPLPGQGAGRGPAGAALRQHAAPTPVGPHLDRPRRDHDGRGLRRRRPRVVLRRRRHRPRRRAEPPPAGARLRGHGSAGQRLGRGPARREVPAAQDGARPGPGRGGARSVRRLPRRSRCRAAARPPRRTWR